MWDLGDTVPLTIEVTDAAGAPTNAATVTLTITLPDGSVLSPVPSNPAVGRYESDFVPTVAGLHVVRWVTTGPAAAWADVVDVRPAAEVSLVSLADAKAHLNKSGSTSVDDEELRPVLVAATQRVARHLTGNPDGLAARTSVSASERLAVLEVLADYWRSQRVAYGARQASGYGGREVEPPAGVPRPPLEVRLTEILGQRAVSSGGVPQGCFPERVPWPV